jgi:hypothetical protein
MQENTPQFEVEDASEIETGGYHFEQEMIGACKPLFSTCATNYEVRDKLEAAGVLTPDMHYEAESGALWATFQEKSELQDFLRRLNGHLEERARLINEFRKLM